MKAWGVTEAEIRAAAAEVGLTVYNDWRGTGVVKDGRALRFRLGLDTARARNANGSLPYQRRSTSRSRPRRIAAVCWHGHRDFMRALFRLAPEARIKTAIADYRGAGDFERRFRSTGDRWGRENDYHRAYDEACDCPPAVAQYEKPALQVVSYR